MEFFDHLEGLITSRVALAKDFFELLRLEASLAGITIYPLLICFAALITLTISFGLAFMVFIGYLIFVLTEQPLVAFATVLLLNLVMILFVLWSILRYLQQMSFAKTRKCLAGNQTRDNYEHKEKPTGLNCQDGSQGS